MSISGTPPIDTNVGADLYQAVEPLTFADASLGWPLAHYLSSNGLMLEEIANLARTDGDGNDGWTAFASPSRCPDNFLYTLAVWAGVTYPRRMASGDLRALIGPHSPALWRGTRDGIIAAMRRFLSPGAPIYFEERAVTPEHPEGDAYYLRIFTYSDSTLDESAIRQELYNTVPAGLIVDYEVRIGQTYGMLRQRCATYQDMKDLYPTYNDAREDAPLP
jgi:hypothetical protein